MAERYAPGAVFRSHPFREPWVGTEGARAYAGTALAFATNPTNLSLRLTEEPESAMKKEEDGSMLSMLE